MKLSSLFDNTARTATVEFVPGAMVTVKYAGPAALRGVLQRATVHKMLQGQGRQPVIDPQKLAQQLAPFVVNWEGMTPRALTEVVVIKEISEEQMNAEVPCNRETVTDLIAELPAFSQWLQATITEPSWFNSVGEDELGNSLTGLSGDSPTEESPALSVLQSTPDTSESPTVEPAPSQS